MTALDAVTKVLPKSNSTTPVNIAPTPADTTHPKTGSNTGLENVSVKREPGNRELSTHEWVIVEANRLANTPDIKEMLSSAQLTLPLLRGVVWIGVVDGERVMTAALELIKEHGPADYLIGDPNFPDMSQLREQAFNKAYAAEIAARHPDVQLIAGLD